VFALGAAFGLRHRQAPAGDRPLARRRRDPRLSRQSTYNAAYRGEIPTIRIGRRVVVPVARLRAMLGLDGGGDDGIAA
jgi:hypothetical protein